MDNLEASDISDAQEPVLLRVWFWWRIIWTVVRNFLYVTVILITFGKASSEFQTLTLCVLILTLQGVNWSNVVQLRMAVEDTLTTRRLLIPLLKVAGEDMAGAVETLNAIEKKFKKQDPIYYINATFSSLIYFVVLWKAFSAVLA